MKNKFRILGILLILLLSVQLAYASPCTDLEFQKAVGAISSSDKLLNHVLSNMDNPEIVTLTKKISNAMATGLISQASIETLDIIEAGIVKYGKEGYVKDLIDVLSIKTLKQTPDFADYPPLSSLLKMVANQDNDGPFFALKRIAELKRAGKNIISFEVASKSIDGLTPDIVYEEVIKEGTKEVTYQVIEEFKWKDTSGGVLEVPLKKEFGDQMEKMKQWVDLNPAKRKARIATSAMFSQKVTDKAKSLNIEIVEALSKQNLPTTIYKSNLVNFVPRPDLLTSGTKWYSGLVGTIEDSKSGRKFFIKLTDSIESGQKSAITLTEMFKKEIKAYELDKLLYKNDPSVYVPHAQLIEGILIQGQKRNAIIVEFMEAPSMLDKFYTKFNYGGVYPVDTLIKEGVLTKSQADILKQRFWPDMWRMNRDTNMGNYLLGEKVSYIDHQLTFSNSLADLGMEPSMLLSKQPVGVDSWAYPEWIGKNSVYTDLADGYWDLAKQRLPETEWLKSVEPGAKKIAAIDKASLSKVFNREEVDLLWSRREALIELYQKNGIDLI